MVFFLGLSLGSLKRESYANESIIWTPKGNPSTISAERINEIFPSKSGFIGIMGEVKNIESATPGTVLTKNAFKELKVFMDELVKLEATYKPGKKD